MRIGILNGDFAEMRAIVPIDAKIEDETQRARLYLSLGNLYSALDRHEDAEPWYRRLMSITPGAYVLLTLSLAKQNRIQDAVEVCLQAHKGSRLLLVNMLSINTLVIISMHLESSDQ